MVPNVFLKYMIFFSVNKLDTWRKTKIRLKFPKWNFISVLFVFSTNMSCFSCSFCSRRISFFKADKKNLNSKINIWKHCVRYLPKSFKWKDIPFLCKTICFVWTVDVKMYLKDSTKSRVYMDFKSLSQTIRHNLIVVIIMSCLIKHDKRLNLRKVIWK